MSSIDTYKTYLGDYLTRFHNITNLKDFFHCLNPEHPDIHPSMHYTSRLNICKCFSCGVRYDIFDLIGMDYNIDNFKEQIDKLEEIYLDKKPVYEEYTPPANINADFTNYYNNCAKNIEESDYLEKRGITKELIKKYNIGFNKNTKFIVFPINKHCYYARSTCDDRKIKNYGASDVWNKELLDNNDIIYLTEGIIDSLSLEVIDPDVKTVSLNGAGNIPYFIYTIKNTKFNGIIVITFDNDARGQLESKKLKCKLDELGITAVSIKLPPENCNDINDGLMNNREGLEKNYKFVNDYLKKIIANKKVKQNDVKITNEDISL